MNQAFTATHVNVPTEVKFHCTHDDGQVTYRIADHPTTVYITGTIEELAAFGLAVITATVIDTLDPVCPSEEVRT